MARFTYQKAPARYRTRSVGVTSLRPGTVTRIGGEVAEVRRTPTEGYLVVTFRDGRYLHFRSDDRITIYPNL